MGAGASAAPITRIKDVERKTKDAFEEEEEEKLNATNEIKIPLINKHSSPDTTSDFKSEHSMAKTKKGKPFVFSPRWNDHSDKKKESLELPPLLIPPSVDKEKQNKKVILYILIL